MISSNSFQTINENIGVLASLNEYLDPSITAKPLISRWIESACECQLVPTERISSKYCPNGKLSFPQEKRARYAWTLIGTAGRRTRRFTLLRFDSPQYRTVWNQSTDGDQGGGVVCYVPNHAQIWAHVGTPRCGEIF